MEKRDITELAVYETEHEAETVLLENIRNLYFEKTAEIIYITRQKKLYGIVCMGEVLCGHRQNTVIRINKAFTSLPGYDIVEAKKIFKRKRKVYKIPVVTQQGELLGDYSRWDDRLFIERNQEQCMKKEAVKNVLQPYESVYVVKPIDGKMDIYKQFIDYLDRFQVTYTVWDKRRITEKLFENAICIFMDEDEKRGAECLNGIEPRLYDCNGSSVLRYDRLVDQSYQIRLTTYTNLLFQIIKDGQLARLNIRKPASLLYDDVNDKATVLLTALKQKGVNCFNLYSTENVVSEYWKNFNNELVRQLQDCAISIKEPWSKGERNVDFYQELYQLEDYKEEKAQKEIFNANCDFEVKKNISGKYFNAEEGKRRTCFQPEKYNGTIYLLGMCTIVGRHVEDQYTVASYMQKKLLDKGYAYRVENYGAEIRIDGAIDTRLEEIGEFNQNDIIICQTPSGKAVDIPGISFEKIYREHQAPAKWCMDVFGHCNHKINQMFADSMLNLIESCLQREKDETNYAKGFRMEFHNIMKEYIRHKYLEQYFSDFSGKDYDTVGAIVMKCNPFTKGHRYIIEEAKKQVDFLIVFVLEEDSFLFSFEERFRLVKEGVQDIGNVLVVPSGDFIFSKSTFWEYYRRAKKEIVEVNAEYDINIFVDYIAKPLHITHRFAGKELKNKVIMTYNETMGRILPQNEIFYVEIPKLRIEGEDVSAIKVRRYIAKKEYSKACALLPDLSRCYLMKWI